MKKLKLLELFGGIGACSKALERLGIDYEIVDYVEIDKYAVRSYNAIHGTNFEPQDIIQWNKDIEVDMIMHGSPCQDFSLAGKQAGGDKDSGTRSSLMYETIRIVEKLKPKYVVWENVKNLLSKKHRHNFDAYLETMTQLGYTNYYQVLNAKDYGIPQNRERVFTVSILDNQKFEFPEGKKCDNKIDVVGNYMPSGYDASRIVNEYGLAPTVKENHGTITAVAINFQFPPKRELKLKLKDMLEDNVDEKYYINDGTLNNIISKNQAGYLSGGKWDKINESCRRYYKEDGMSPSICTCQGGNTEPKVLIKKLTNNLQIRKLTSKECWRLMGFDDEDFNKASKVNSNTQLYKQAGNSIVVNVLEAIFENLLADYKWND